MNIYEIPSIPESLRPNRLESEISFVAPVARTNYVVNPSFETDAIGETQPYNWSVGEYSYVYNQLFSQNSVGSVVSENVYSGFKAFRVNLSDIDTSIVYGINNPIQVPQKSNKLISSTASRSLYSVNGALSFYIFAPAIVGSSRFAMFNQAAGSEHVIDVDVFATVDAFGEPNNTFNEQNIINSAQINVVVTDSSYFSELVEPYVIGKRKNPEWQRYVVHFTVDVTPEETTYLRFSIKNNDALFAGSGFIFYLDAVQVEFYDDDMQRPTTYFDGDSGVNDASGNRGYYWDGVRQKSISHRSIEASTGGVLYNLQNDFGFQVVTINGLGLPQTENTIEPYLFSDGQQYRNSGINGREITIVGTVTNGTLLEAFRKAGQLQFMLSKERSGIASTRRFYFRIPSLCGTPSEYTYFDAVINNVIVEPISNSPIVTMTIELNNINVYFVGDNYSFIENNTLYKPEVLKRFDVVLFQAQGGSAIKDYISTYPRQSVTPVKPSWFGHSSYNMYTNGRVLTWCELSNGNIAFGGDFTKVTYIINNVPITVNCNRIAFLRDDGTVIPMRRKSLKNFPRRYNRFNGVAGPGAVVRSIIQTNDKAIVIGGRFESVLNITTDCKNIVYLNDIDISGDAIGEFRDVEGGLFATGTEQGVFALKFHQASNTILVGGSFSRAYNSSYTAATQLRNIAIYTINAQNKWSQLHYGANGIVRSIDIVGNLAILGGDFTAMYASSGVNFRTETKHACIYNLNRSVPFGQRILSLSQVDVMKTVTGLPANDSTFNAAVKKVLVDTYKNVIIGGNFTEVYYNGNTLPSPSLQSLSASRIVRWDGFNRFTQMGLGISNGPGMYPYSLTINDICSSPYNDDVYAVGRFSAIGDINQAVCIARWAKNRWEAMDFEMQVRDAYSVFVSKRGYGFVSVLSNPTNGTNKLYEPIPIVIDNVAIQNNFVLEITNPIVNKTEYSLISLYNVTTDKSITFNLEVAVGETITIDFTKENIMPQSNIRSRVTNSVVGGGTFGNFFLENGVNIIKILGGHRNGYAFATSRQIQIGIRYHAKQVSPYQIYETGTVKNKRVNTQWKLNSSKLGIDTRIIQNLKVEFPAFNWGSFGTWTLDRDVLGDDSVVNT